MKKRGHWAANDERELRPRDGMRPHEESWLGLVHAGADESPAKFRTRKNPPSGSERADQDRGGANESCFLVSRNLSVMHHLLVSEIEGLVRPDKYPLSSSYDPRWVLGLDMGPHPLWQLEDLMAEIELRPGMRVLDLGSGRGATSVFLAREFGVDVAACDLWVSAEEAQQVFDAAGVADRVVAVNADVRALPFSDAEFDAIISIDAFEYFGTDVHLLPRLLRVLKPDGPIGMSTPALRVDPYEEPVPTYVWEVFGHEVAAWHSPAWWQRHWELSELLEDVHARWQEGGRDDWLLWQRADRDYKGEDSDVIVDMLERDVDELIGFTLISARKRYPGKPS